MSIATRLAFALLGFLVGATALPAQPDPPAAAASNRIFLDVVVTPKSGPPVAGLQQGDFTVLDNKVAQPIRTFAALGGPQAPIEVVLLIDSVNVSYRDLGYERDQIDRLLRANNGRLEHPTSLVLFSDRDTVVKQDFTTDGNAISAALDQTTIALRDITRAAGVYGAEDRLQISLTALHSITTRLAARPGRKIILWVSPGWPILSGPNIDLDTKQQRQIFSDVTGISTLLLRAGITLYSIDPLGTNEDVQQATYYELFLKGLAQPNQAQIGSLGLQVLAIQSGGLALRGSNDISGMLARCLADTESYYELSFDAPPAERALEYHEVQIKLANRGLTARTRAGYYWQP
jgi:VWFA-related protein